MNLLSADNGWAMGDYNQLELSVKTMALRKCLFTTSFLSGHCSRT